MRGLALLVAALVAAPLAGQPMPLDGQEFQVNDSISHNQMHPALALAANGTAMFVWETEYPSGHHDVKKVEARLFRPGGAPIAGQFRVDDPAFLYSDEPAISGDGANGFVVAWRSLGAAPDPGSAWGVLARRYGRGGLPKGDRFAVASISGRDQYAPIAASGEGQFAVAWVDCWTDFVEACERGAELQRFHTDESPAGEQLELLEPVRKPAIGIASSFHGWNLVWGDAASRLWGLFLDPTGAPLGEPVELVEFALRFSTAVDPLGNLVVVWLEPSVEPDAYEVNARLFDSNGAPRGDPFRVDAADTTAAAFWSAPQVAVDASGDFVVVWESEDDPPEFPDTEVSDIQARRFDADGLPQGDAFRVNTVTWGTQRDPAIATEDLGNFVIVWSSQISREVAPDLDIEARRYHCGLFCDGFERGSRSAWSE